MDPRIFTTRDAETPEAKALWFRSLPLKRRMEVLCEFTDLVLSQQPDIADKKRCSKS